MYCAGPQAGGIIEGSEGGFGGRGEGHCRAGRRAEGAGGAVAQPGLPLPGCQ